MMWRVGANQGKGHAMNPGMKEGSMTVKKMRETYKRASWKEKKEMLGHLEKEHGYNRQYASRLLLGKEERKEGEARRGRKAVYAGLRGTVKQLWQLYDYICSKRLAPVMREAVRKLEAFGEMKLDKETKEKLLGMSARTMDRLLARDRKALALRSKARTRPGTLLKHQVPVKTHREWKDTEPGFVQVDCVGHDGGNAGGDFNQTVDVTDVATGWTETQAVKNKAQVWVFEALKEIRAQLPFPMKGLHSDSGGEFINNQLFRYCKAGKITFTRSRPGRKNDNPHVEQKNWSVVRRAVGYGRYEDDERLLNALYRVLRLYTNFFMPVMKCVGKTRHGSRVTRHYDTAKTPYHRVLESACVCHDDKARLRATYATLNPVALKRQIARLQGRLVSRAARHGTPMVLAEVA